MSRKRKRSSESDDERLFKLAFGMWKDRNIDGVEYTRALRAEWDERFPVDDPPSPPEPPADRTPDHSPD